MGDLYLRTDRPVDAMAEMAVLNRLLPTGSQQLAPSLAAYAKAPGSIPQIKDHPRILSRTRGAAACDHVVRRRQYRHDFATGFLA